MLGYSAADLHLWFRIYKNWFSLLFTSGEMKRKQDRLLLLKIDKFTETSLDIDIQAKALLVQYVFKVSK